MRALRTLMLLLLLAPLSLYRAYGSMGTVAGRVLLESREPALGAVVLLAETKLGAAAFPDGSFIIANVPPGDFEVRARLVGFEQTEAVRASVRDQDTVWVELILHPQAIELPPVTVSGSRRQSAEDTRASVSTLAPRESKFLPGAAEDVLRSLQTLPGVTSVNDFSSQLVVRGSGPDQNLIMIDGYEVINPYRLYGFVSMFNPETLSDISLQTGGFAAEYGDRLSAVLDVRNREGRADVAVAGKLNLSLTNMNLILEGALPFAGSSYLISARRTYYDLILGPVVKKLNLLKGDVALPNFRDLQVKFAFPLDESNKILLDAVTSRDGASVVSGEDRPTPDSVGLFDQSYNNLVGGTWQYTPSRDLVLRTQVSWYRNNGAGSLDASFVDPAQNTGDLGRTDTAGIRLLKFGLNYDYRYTKISLGEKILWNSGVHAAEGGIGVDFLQTDFTRYFELDKALKDFIISRGQPVPVDVTETVRFSRSNAFLQDRIRLSDGFFIQPGLRLDVYPSLQTGVYLSPRVNVSYKVDDLSTLRAAYGTYYQSPGMEKQNFQARIIFTGDSFGKLRAERADHYILGFDRMITPEWQLKLEVYDKQFTNVMVPTELTGATWYVAPTGVDITSPQGWTTPIAARGDSLTPFPVNDASGSSEGFEVLLQKVQNLPSDRFTGWVSYALSYAVRERDGVRTPFQFDQRHAVNVVGNYRFAENWDVGVSFTLRSGKPFADARGVKPRVVITNVGGAQVPAVEIDQNGKVVLDVDYEQQTLSGRLGLYHSLDIRITTYPRWFSLEWSLYLDVQNVYNHQNEQAVSYFIDDAGNLNRRAVNGIPIFPSLGISVIF